MLFSFYGTINFYFRMFFFRFINKRPVKISGIRTDFQFFFLLCFFTDAF